MRSDRRTGICLLFANSRQVTSGCAFAMTGRRIRNDGFQKNSPFCYNPSKVIPIGIKLFDQVFFFLSRTCFELLLAGYGFFNGVEILEINQVEQVVSGSKTIRIFFGLMLFDPCIQIGGNAHIKRCFILVGHDVYRSAFFHSF